MYTLYVSNNSTAMSQLELAKSQSKPFLQAVKVCFFITNTISINQQKIELGEGNRP